MIVSLAQDEKIIREWTYSTTKASNVKAEQSLVVTNKRVIHNTDMTGGMASQSVNISSINQSEVRVLVSRNVVWLILGMLACFFAIFSIIEGGEFSTVSIIALLLGVLFIILFAVLKTISFYLDLGRCSSDTAIQIGSKFAAKANGKVSVKVSEEAAKEIANELYAIILDVQAGKYSNN